LSYSTDISVELPNIADGALIGGYTFNTQFKFSIVSLAILQSVPPFNGNVSILYVLNFLLSLFLIDPQSLQIVQAPSQFLHS
jgi:hypothetical protein